MNAAARLGDPAEKDRQKAISKARDVRDRLRRELQAIELAEARAEVERNHAQAMPTRTPRRTTVRS